MATSLQDRTGGMVNQAIDRGTDVLADRVEHYALVAREMCDVLRQRGEPQAAEMLETGVNRMTDVTSYLRQSDGTRLMSDVQEFARGRTWLVAGVGFMGGILAARAIRAGTASVDDGWQQRPYTEQFDQERAYGRT